MARPRRAARRPRPRPRGRRVARLGLRRRGCGVRRTRDGGGTSVPRSLGGHDARARRQDRRQRARRARRRPGGTVEQRRRLARDGRGTRRPHRVPAHGEGERGWRRARDPDGRGAGGARRGGELRHRGGGSGVRRRAGLPRAAGARRTARRGADRGRQARAHRRVRMPGLLGPAPPPEGARGGTARRGAARDSRGARSGGRSHRRRGRVRRRRNRRVPARRRDLLLPGGQPAPPGRARDHGGDHGRRPRPAPGSGSPAARRCPPSARPSVALPSRRGSAPRSPRPASLPPPDGSPASIPFSAPTSGSTPAWSPAAGCRPPSTRSSPR